jgi:formylglycine-generating enzyme required for sulfatase activity
VNRGTKAALVVLGIAVAAAPFWVALTIPLEKFEAPKTPAAPASVLTDLARWDAATPASRRAAAEDVARRLPDFVLSRMETFSCGGQAHEVAIYAHAKTGMEFVLVPVGTFVMGAPKGEAGRDEAEAQHTVTLTGPFLICRTECTQAAFERVTKTNPSAFKGSGNPVDSVSWNGAAKFCAETGLELPSESQWEWACRAGMPPSPSDADRAALAALGWFAVDSGETTHPVGEKQQSALGLHDMLGNVCEWCADGYGAYPAQPVSDPTGDEASKWRVSRGGAWCSPPKFVRAAARFGHDAGNRTNEIGFRPAKTVPME